MNAFEFSNVFEKVVFGPALVVFGPCLMIYIIFGVLKSIVIYIHETPKRRERKQEQLEYQRKRDKEWWDNYRNYLKSDTWRRKRYVVLKRDNWKCLRCGEKAEQVHHLKYPKIIGKEPISWLESICISCHDKEHDHKRT